MNDVIIDKLAFESRDPRDGFTLHVYWLTKPKGDALVEIRKDEQPYRRFLYPAYKVFNLSAHWEDIVQSEIQGNLAGYDLAGWDGFNVVHPQVLKDRKESAVE
jgi:hypothetical protein